MGSRAQRARTPDTLHLVKPLTLSAMFLLTAHNGRWFTRCRLSQIAHASTRNRHLGKSCYVDADNTASRFALTHVSNVCGLFPVRSSTTLVTLPKLSRPS